MDGGRNYRFSYAPYQREIAESIHDPGNQMTVMMMASRLGKTEVVLNAIGHSIDAAPRRILVMFPTTSQGEKFSKETCERELFEPTSSLRWLVRGGKRDGSNTIMHKMFPGGLMSIFGGNAPGELRRSKGNFLFADEVDALQSDKADEGDQLEILWVRGSEYPDTIRVACSYPSIVGHSRIARLMSGSDYRKWFVPCPRCKNHIVMERSHITWEPGKPETALVRCPECGDGFNDEERRGAVSMGEWRATRAYEGISGFWGNGMLSPHPVQRGFDSHIHWVAAQTEAAEKAANPERARRVMVNTFDALPFQGKLEEKPDADTLMQRREQWNTLDGLPSGVLAIYWGADVQGDRIEIEFVGFGLNDETWALRYIVVTGSPLKSDTWNKFDAVVNMTFTHPVLGVISARGGCIDSRYQSARVRRWTRGKHQRGIFAITGSTVLGKAPTGKPTKVGRPPVFVYELGTHELKDVIYQRLDLRREEGETTTPQGTMHFPATEEYNEAYFNGLTIEDSVMKKAGDGNDYRFFEKPKGARNEPLDVRVYAMAAKEINRPQLGMLAKQVREKSNGELPQEPAKKRRSRIPRQRWNIGSF